MIRTLRMPVAGEAIHGLALSVSPKTAAPLTRSNPASRISPMAALCRRAAALMPSTLTTVTTTALPAPTTTKPTSTSAPRTVHRVPMRIPGIRYSTAVGSAMDSNRHTFT